VLNHLGGGFGHKETTRHPEMNDPLRIPSRFGRLLQTDLARTTFFSLVTPDSRGNRLEIKDDMLSGTMDLQDFFVFESPGYQSSGRFKWLILRSDPHGLDRVSGDSFIKSARNGFNLGKFGHES
jgi:hypothetical protein